jgi:hypothetical protein
MLTDIEKDIWTRCFINVDRRSTVRFTFDRQLATNKKFPKSLGVIDKTKLTQQDKPPAPATPIRKSKTISTQESFHAQADLDAWFS